MGGLGIICAQWQGGVGFSVLILSAHIARIHNRWRRKRGMKQRSRLEKIVVFGENSHALYVGGKLRLSGNALNIVDVLEALEEGFEVGMSVNKKMEWPELLVNVKEAVYGVD